MSTCTSKLKSATSFYAPKRGRPVEAADTVQRDEAPLLEVSGLTGKTIDSYHIGFMLAPRVNAAGRR